MLKRIMLTALAAGAIAGVFMWAIQAATVTPLILHAEAFEQKMASAPAGAAAGHAHAADDSHAEWAPSDGFERTAFTLMADLVIAMGFAFILTGALALSGGAAGWRRGIVWGLAGFAAFSAAPALGLPPALPGMQAADLVARQIWWVGTVAGTITGMVILFFAPRPVPLVLSAVLILAPHIIGAPSHALAARALPATLAAEFAVASLVTAQLFWMVLGGATGYFFDRLKNA
jgi:cobalt transporter subunit CbtA